MLSSHMQLVVDEIDGRLFNYCYNDDDCQSAVVVSTNTTTNYGFAPITTQSGSFKAVTAKSTLVNVQQPLFMVSQQQQEYTLDEAYLAIKYGLQADGDSFYDDSNDEDFVCDDTTSNGSSDDEEDFDEDDDEYEDDIPPFLMDCSY